MVSPSFQNIRLIGSSVRGYFIQNWRKAFFPVFIIPVGYLGITQAFYVPANSPFTEFNFVDDFLTMEQVRAAWEIVKEKEREWVLENLSLYALQILPGCPQWIQNWAKTLLELKEEYNDKILIDILDTLQITTIKKC